MMRYRQIGPPRHAPQQELPANRAHTTSIEPFHKAAIWQFGTRATDWHVVRIHNVPASPRLSLMLSLKQGMSNDKGVMFQPPKVISGSQGPDYAGSVEPRIE